MNIVDVKNLTMNDVKFVYFRRNGGTITVAYTVLNREEKKGVFKVVFDWSACSPKDRFDKRVGRNMAFGRLFKRMRALDTYNYINQYSDFEFDDNPAQGLFKQTVEHLERHLFYSGDYMIPRWYTRSYSTPKYLANKAAQNVAEILQSNSASLTKVEAKFLKSLIDHKTNNFI
jgi:hypothetical protein